MRPTERSSSTPSYAPGGEDWVRPLGATGLSATALGLGGGPLASMPDVLGYVVPEARALDLIDAVLHSPISVIDTSNNYNDGESERRIGAAWKRAGRPADTLIITKADALGVDFSGARVRRSIEESMNRLGMDFLPLVHLHDPESFDFAELTGSAGAVAALVQLQAEGVIGSIGIAGGHVPTIRRYVDLGVFDALLTHNRYTLVDHSAEQLIQNARERGMAIFNAAVFGGGILASSRSGKTTYAYRPASPAVLRGIAGLIEIADRLDTDLGVIALQASMRDPLVDCTLIGMSRPERVAWALEAASQPLPEEIWDQVVAHLPQTSHWIDASD